MKLQFPEKQIKEWAKIYVDTCDESHFRDESHLIELRDSILSAGHISKDNLRLIAKWKSPRSAGYMEKNSEEYVKEITKWSFSATNERSKIEVLTLLNGVQWPSASVIFHFFREEYPILDVRALSSVGVKVPSQYTYEFWWTYVEFCRNLANRNGVTMRELDRALWQYSKNPNI